VRRSVVPPPRTAVATTVRRWVTVSMVVVGLGALTPASPAEAVASTANHASVQTGTTVGPISTVEYGSVLMGGGKAGIAPLANYPFYEISSDYDGKFGCTTRPADGFDLKQGEIVPDTCTGPESDELNSVTSDDSRSQRLLLQS